MMRKLLQPLRSQDVDNFIDDILIATQTVEEHYETVRQVLDRLRECSLTARPTKCYLGCSEVEYLGHMVGGGKLWPVAEKMAKIRDANAPQTKRQVRSFLGLVGYYRRFIPNFADIAQPLTELTRKTHTDRVRWNPEAERAFQELKRCFCSAPVCVLPDPTRQFVLQTDASGTGIGAILLQEVDGDLHPVACASKKLSTAEMNYATIEKECLALVWGIHRFEKYLYGAKFVVQTDHSPLQYLERAKSLSGRLTRWALQLQPYNFHIQSLPGKENHAADFLSRMD